MPERYGRSVCSTELQLRNTIVHKFATGWEPADAYHIPTTVAGNLGIGKPPGEETPAGDETSGIQMDEEAGPSEGLLGESRIDPVVDTQLDEPGQTQAVNETDPVGESTKELQRENTQNHEDP